MVSDAQCLCCCNSSSPCLLEASAEIFNSFFRIHESLKSLLPFFIIQPVGARLFTSKMGHDQKHDAWYPRMCHLALVPESLKSLLGSPKHTGYAWAETCYYSGTENCSCTDALLVGVGRFQIALMKTKTFPDYEHEQLIPTWLILNTTQYLLILAYLLKGMI